MREQDSVLSKALMRLDFPQLDLPAKAISPACSGGNCFISAALASSLKP